MYRVSKTDKHIQVVNVRTVRHQVLVWDHTGCGSTRSRVPVGNTKYKYYISIQLK